VYDLTTFAPDHPGGIDILKECAGTDATEPYEYAGHSDQATATMQKFLVGALEGSEVVETPVAQVTKVATSATKGTTWANSGPFTHFQKWAAVASGVLVTLLYLLFFRAASGRAESENIGGGAGTNVQSLFSGLFLGLVAACAGPGYYVYKEFKRSLPHEKDVFAYPSTIPRRVK